MKYIGIDGCRGGWILIGLDDDGNSSHKLLSHIQELDAYLDAATLVLIDVPIGLRNRHPDERRCDKEARRVLRPKRSSSVFVSPSRCALQAKSYEEASQLNRECTGRGLSRQSYAIIPKIKEVDVYLEDINRQEKIHEMHPEVCFWALNDKIVMKHNKKTSDGYLERIAVLTKHYPMAEKVISICMEQYRRANVQRDDIVDALAGAVTGLNSHVLRRFPEVPEIDDKGCKMEIVY